VSYNKHLLFNEHVTISVTSTVTINNSSENLKKMPKLNKDILFLLFEEFQDDSQSLFSFSMVDRLWCETVIPVLWRNPWKYNIDYRHKSSLYYIITSYLSDSVKQN
jgi:hypothetical protein